MIALVIIRRLTEWVSAHRRGLLDAVEVLALLVLALSIARWPTPRRSSVSPQLQFSIDSSQVAGYFYRAARDSSVHQEAAHADTARAAEQHAKRSRAHADAIGRVADSAEAVAHTTIDTMPWHVALAQRDRQVDSLEASNDSLTAALTQAKLAQAEADARAKRSDDRAADLDRLNATIAKQLAASDPPCYVLPFVRCPSRKFVAGAGLLGGIVLDEGARYLLHRR